LSHQTSAGWLGHLNPSTRLLAALDRSLSPHGIALGHKGLKDGRNIM
jgi:hypothetical protein